MSLLSIDSHDHYSDITLKYSSASTAVISAGVGRKGTAGIVTNETTFFTLDRVAVDQPIAALTLVRGLAMKLDGLPAATQTVMQFQEADGTNQVCIGVLNNGTVRAFKGNTAGTTLASSASPITADIYYYLEVKVFIDNVAGRVVVKLWTDATTSSTIIDFTGDTQNGGAGTLAKIKHGLGLAASWDDGYLCDTTGSAFNDFLGNKFIEARFPNEAGFYTEWEPFPVGAPNWENVNENPPDDDTSYNSISGDVIADGESDTFGTQVTASESVNAAVVNLCAQVSIGSGAVGARMRQSATDADTDTVEPSGDYLIYQFPFETAPDAGAWSTAKYNASESGYVSEGTEPTVTTFSNTAPITIVDEDVASPYPSSITVSALTGTVTKVTVTITGFSHNFPSDVLMLLVGPTGATCAFWGRAGFDQAVSNLTITLDDEAADFLSEPGPLVNGTFKPTFYPFSNPFDPSTFPSPAPDPTESGSITLSTFLNIDPNGQWDLYVVDEFSPDSGSISGGWSLTITTEGSQAPNLHFDRTHNAKSDFGTVTPNNFSTGTQWAICTTDPLVAEGDCFQWQVTGDIPQLYVGVVDDPNMDLGVDWPNTTITRVPYGLSDPGGLRAFFDHPDPETLYDEGADIFKIVRDSDGLSYYRNSVFLDKRFAGADPSVLPDPMPPLYPAMLGGFEAGGPTYSGIGGAQSCQVVANEVRVTQVAVELVVPFTEGNVTMSGVRTERFDSGEGSEWYIVPAVVDLGDELRAKTLKAMRVTGRVTNASAMAYGYDVGDGIVTSDLESGSNSSTGAIPLVDTTNVAQSVRYPINVKNAVLSTLRVEGDDTGQPNRDQVHEIIMEAAIDNVRR